MDKSDITFSEMLSMQRELWEKYKESWSPLEPVYARNSLLWMFGELGEVIDLIKKQGEEKTLSTPALRAHLVEEICDVLMYLNDALMRYDVTPSEIANAYVAKHEINMKRDYDSQNAKKAEEIIHRHLKDSI